MRVVSSITAIAVGATATGSCAFSASLMISPAAPNRPASRSTRIAGDLARDSRSAIAAVHDRSRSGSLGGSPTQAGTFSTTVTVTDANMNSASASITINVLGLTTTVLPGGTYNFNTCGKTSSFVTG